MAQSVADLPALYLDVMKRALTRADSSVQEVHELEAFNATRLVLRPAQRLLARKGYRLVGPPVVPETREEGHDFPTTAETMIGLRRLENIQHCVEAVLADRVPGDLIETGVWRGGAVIFMRAVLAAYNVTDRLVWVADSFAGLPKPDIERFPADRGLDLYRIEQLAVSLDQVKANFARYGLLDDQVGFLPGWFKDTLPEAPIDQLAVVRLDGDLYESTLEAISALYPKLTAGGFLIVDDYNGVAACRQAINDYREYERIEDPIERIDWTGIYWRKT